MRYICPSCNHHCERAREAAQCPVCGNAIADRPKFRASILQLAHEKEVFSVADVIAKIGPGYEITIRQTLADLVRSQRLCRNTRYSDDIRDVLWSLKAFDLAPSTAPYWEQPIDDRRALLLSLARKRGCFSCGQLATELGIHWRSQPYALSLLSNDLRHLMDRDLIVRTDRGNYALKDLTNVEPESNDWLERANVAARYSALRSTMVLKREEAA
jgi:hypothetical protein